MKAIVSILFSLALVWSQWAFAAKEDTLPRRGGEKGRCACPKRMACCAAPNAASIPYQQPVSPETRTASRDAGASLPATRPEALFALAPPDLPVSSSDSASPFPQTGTPPLYTRFCSLLI